ncbi:MAG: glycosyltransferase family 2 protein [Paludibacteraceae bacterium]|nr:glycosyltransferase family 2 protein [Paludibacteraceae bacterium]
MIIPCYNQALFLPKAIASLQAQTLEDWECIIVDDGSTDNTAEVAANLALQDGRVHMLQKINGGSASARDLGLKHAQGEYIQFLDADDWLEPEKLARQVALMEGENLDISYTAYCSENSNGHRTKPQSVKLNLYKILVHWGLGASVPVHSFLYQTDFIKKHRLTFQNSCRFREDWRWHILCYKQRPKTAVIPNYCGAIYYQNEQGKTGSYVRMQEGNFAFMASMAKQLKGTYKFLWVFRISEELWIWMLRMFKYRSTKIAKSILLLDTGWTIAAILLMPISFWWIAVYFIKTYIAR